MRLEHQKGGMYDRQENQKVNKLLFQPLHDQHIVGEQYWKNKKKHQNHTTAFDAGFVNSGVKVEPDKEERAQFTTMSKSEKLAFIDEKLSYLPGQNPKNLQTALKRRQGAKRQLNERQKKLKLMS